MVARKEDDARAIPVKHPLGQIREELVGDLVLRRNLALPFGLAELRTLNDVTAHYDGIWWANGWGFANVAVPVAEQRRK